MQELHDLSKPFKYVVSCVIVQKNGAGFHIGHSAFWDISNDNVCQVSFATVGGHLVGQNVYHVHGSLSVSLSCDQS